MITWPVWVSIQVRNRGPAVPGSDWAWSRRRSPACCTAELTESRAGGRAWWSVGSEGTAPQIGPAARSRPPPGQILRPGHRRQVGLPERRSVPCSGLSRRRKPRSRRHRCGEGRGPAKASALPAKYRINPPWVAPAVLLGLLAALIIGDPGRIDRQKTWLRIVTGAVIACLTLANLAAAARLVHDIITNNKLYASNATGLLATGAVIWATNVIAFGLWYWDLDRGGAAARAHHPQANPAFVFPEMLHTEYVPSPWVPQFVDYLSLGFWTATAFSPTDTSAIKPWAKLMMITEAAVSVVIGALVIARAINILA